ncbi:MAG: hypothetical protein GTN39_00725 [Candidatus Aenigmarchaeota archaeon]|nr:hypothetical protein [Candidatus Aenigmarchaeota archaeon]
MTRPENAEKNYSCLRIFAKRYDDPKRFMDVFDFISYAKKNPKIELELVEAGLATLASICDKKFDELKEYAEENPDIKLPMVGGMKSPRRYTKKEMIAKKEEIIRNSAGMIKKCFRTLKDYEWDPEFKDEIEEKIKWHLERIKTYFERARKYVRDEYAYEKI